MSKKSAAVATVLFFVYFWGGLAFADGPCPPGKDLGGQTKGLSVPLCVQTCEKIAGQSDAAIHAWFEKACRAQIEKDPQDWASVSGVAGAAGEIAHKALLQCLPKAVKKAGEGVVDMVKALPYVVSQLMNEMAGAAARNQLPADFRESLGACQQSAECKRAVARNIVELQKQENGSGYKMSNDELDKFIGGRDLNQLLVEGQHLHGVAKQECLRDLADLRRKEGYGGVGWSDDSNGRVYAQLATEHPHCPGVLKLYPSPKADAKNAKTTAKAGTAEDELWDRLSYFDKFAVKTFCQPDFQVDFCAEVVKAFIPLPIFGPQTSFLRPSTATAAAVAAKAASVEGDAALRAAVSSGTNIERGVGAGSAGSAGSATAPAAAAADLRSSATTASTTVKSPYSPAQLESQRKLVAAQNGKVFVSEQENLKFIDKLEATAKSPEKKALIFDTENSVMKDLNGGTANKDLVTSVTNLHKDIFLGKVKELKAKYPGVDFDIYSDFKSVKVLTSKTEGLSAETQKALMKDFDQALIATNKEFAEKVRPLGINVPKAGPPENWFHGGVDHTDMKANLWAREDRGGATGGFAKAADLEEKVQDKLAAVESERQALVSSPGMRDLLDKTGSEGPIPRADVFELTRKYDTPEDLAKAVRTRYDKPDFSLDEAKQLKQYANDVNGFSPPILIAKRETLSYEAAEKCGALSADMCGLGAENLHATAKGLVKRKSLDDAMPAVRGEEQRVTKSFNARKDKLRDAMGGAQCTGDDCLKALEKTMTLDDKAKLMNKVARDPETRRIRMAMTDPGVAAEDGVELLYHGEKIESTMRAKLEGKVPFAKLQQMTFGLNMSTVKLNEGTVNLIVGRSTGVRLSNTEREAIQKAFNEALTSVNGTQRAYKEGSTILRETKLRFVPGPAVIDGNSDR